MAETGTVRRPWRAWAALAVAVVVVVVAAVLVVRGVRGTDPAGTPSPVTSSAPGTSASASPSAPATPSATASSAEPSTSPRRTPSRSSAPSPSATTADPTAAASTRTPVPLDKPDTVEQGLTARVSELESVKGDANGPGEIAGPALRASISLRNRSGKTLDLSDTVVNLYYGADETPGSAVSGPGVRRLPNRVKAGDTATGRYVFSVPADQRDDVLITVDYSVDTPVVAFRGRAPR